MGFLGLGGSSAKTDRGVELGGFQDLKNIFNFGLDTAKTGTATGAATTTSGVNSLGDSLAYWKNLLSGNRATLQQAVAPETNAVLAQADAGKRQQEASGTARGGGTAGVSQTVNDQAMAKVDNALFGVRPEAAQQEASIGGKLADVGTRETGNALNALQIGEEGAKDLTSNARQSRTDSFDINKATQAQILDTIGSVLSFGFTGATKGLGAAMKGAGL